MDQQLKLVSYNSTGFGPGKPEYLSKLLECHDFVLLQEHWLRESQFHRIKNIPYNGAMVLSHDVSAIDDKVFTQGRGFGGVSIVWKNTLKATVTPIIMSSKRVCAVSVHMDKHAFILFNVYMPCDNPNNLNEYVSVWADIMSICEQSQIYNVIIGGDLNTSVERIGSTFTQFLCNFVNSEQLYICDDSPLCHIDFTYKCPVYDTLHVIDHFIVNNALVNEIIDYRSIHDGDNLSSHCPISLSLDVNVAYMSASSGDDFIPRPKWSDVSDVQINEYKVTLDDFLNDITIPWDVIHCSDPLCGDREEHCQRIQLFHDSIIDMCLITSEKCIPHTSKRCSKSPNIAGWSDIVKPYKEASIFWHNVWKDCGSPRNAAIADVMRRARAKYHSVVKQVKKDQNKIKRDKLAQTLLCDRSKSFWNEVRKANGKCNTVPNMIDGVIGEENISEVFANKYESLYNSVSYDENDMNELAKTLNARITDDTVQYHISYENVVAALSNIKRGKNDGYGMLYSDHFINGPSRLLVLLSMLFNSMIVHGFSPDGFNVSTIQPLVKNKRKSLNDSSNYRAIALSSPLSKIFDWVILNKSVDQFDTSNMQYGFKAKSSTTQCTFALTETINYYRQHNSDVYVLLLDASQAFDKVNYTKLFHLLIERNINPLVIRCLLYMYTNQYLNIKWNCCMSNYFATSNGVKQGGVLSPILFSVYIDKLLCRLRESGYGCRIGHLYYGAIGYADDVSFMSPSLYALNKMCQIALEYAEEYDIKFNPLKCQFLSYAKNENVVMNFNGIDLHSVSKGLHLGHIIGPNVEENVMLDASYTLTRNVNYILYNFNHCSYDVKYRLFNSYCTSFYGCPLWNLSSKYMSIFYVTWRKAIRKLFDLPLRTHCDLLPVIANCKHIETQLLCRFTKFIYNALSSQNKSLQLLVNITTHGSRSATASSFNHLLSKSCLTLHMFKTCTLAKLLQIVSSINGQDNCTFNIGAFARSVVFDRESPSFLSIDELNSILTFLCTN